MANGMLLGQGPVRDSWGKDVPLDGSDIEKNRALEEHKRIIDQLTPGYIHHWGAIQCGVKVFEV